MTYSKIRYKQNIYYIILFITHTNDIKNKKYYILQYTRAKN